MLQSSTNDYGMFIVTETTAAFSFTYFKERSKIKALGDKFVLGSTSVVNVSHVSWQNLCR